MGYRKYVPSTLKCYLLFKCLKRYFSNACDINSITITTSRMTTLKTVKESSENKHTN